MNSPPTFNLLHEPWIPVRPLNGGPVREVGLRELLLHAHTFGRIDDPSPLVTVALLRLTLALLHRALRGPTTTEQAAEWYAHGFPTKTLEAYFQTWEDHFDLFHPQKPFWQQKSDKKEPEQYHWSLLSPELNGSNTTPVFGTKKRAEAVAGKSAAETTVRAWLGSTSPAQVARLLIQNQSFSLGGRITGASDSQQGGPVMSKALFVATGRNLHETLCLNLLPYPADMAEVDRAVWEWQAQGEDRTAGASVPLGYADRYTWLSRSILATPEPTDALHTLGYGAGIARVEDTHQGRSLEPMAALVSRMVENKAALTPLKFSLEKLVWRDLQAILPEPQNQVYVNAQGKVIRVPGFAPLTIRNAAQVLDLVNEAAQGESIVQVHAYGQILGDKAGKTSAFRHESYALPLPLLQDWERGGQHVDTAFREAKLVGSALLNATLRLAAEVVSRGGEREPHKDDVRNLAQTLPGLGAYWAALEAPFRVFLAGLNAPEEAATAWRASVTREARAAWDMNVQGAGGDGQVLGFAFRPRRTDGKYQPSPQGILDRTLASLSAAQRTNSTAPEVPS
ncbi:type I-E CRISPR-associated protein Cse1/CasA [Deinococcus aerophilus]|uniref:CRISPR-associated protein CasA/Cse1 n=1 Tax=Deinococcus aerophilus TaxID=522488 RepID=A0ABQ2GZX8_9DEIO|nr:type I-E CRISPR-associated protein Cse1/CasA [Deinococcus aerophilus]GGM21805.1 CRISPR-associated protein CasA/Cse1 [Deinococcus aerophilus]